MFVRMDMATIKLQFGALVSIAVLLPLSVTAQSQPSRRHSFLAAVRSADTTISEDSEAPDHLQLRTGASAGNLRYQGGRTETAAAFLHKLALGDQVSFGITPTFAHVSFPAASGSAAGNVSGLADLPVGVDLQHSFGGRFEPNVGLS